MANQLVLGTAGDINYVKRFGKPAKGAKKPPVIWRARCRVCTIQGIIKEICATGRTKSEARALITAKVSEAAPKTVADPEVVHGKPRIAGTRMRVVDVMDLLAAGATVEEMTEDYPYVTAEDVQACIAYTSAEYDRATL